MSNNNLRFEKINKNPEDKTSLRLYDQESKSRFKKRWKKPSCNNKFDNFKTGREIDQFDPNAAGNDVTGSSH